MSNSSNATHTGFNVAFGLLHDNFTQVRNIEEYFVLTARLYRTVNKPVKDPKFDVDKTWTSVDNRNYYKDIPFHKCNDEDRKKIYPA